MTGPTDTLVATTNSIDVRGVRKSYGSTVALDGVDLTVANGEIVALLGPNGAGKTTLIETLAGFRDLEEGTVSVLGADPTTRKGARSVRQKVGLVLQQTGHPRYLTVREVLAMHAAWHVDPRPVEEVIALVGLDGLEKRFIRELSGGQQRRLDVGVALVGKPELMFLDEPTTGFDPAARRKMWELVSSLRELGTSVLLTTHYMEEAQTLADRVTVLVNGRIVANGTASELARMLQLQSVISCTLPEGHSLESLPESVRSGAVDGEGVFSVTTPDPTRAMADLCNWAIALGVELEDLSLLPPTLETSYLHLTGENE